MPDMSIGMLRSGTKPGDMVIRVNTGGVIGGAISTMTNSEFVHGGLAVGENYLIEVNGGLNPDSTGSRLLANIYKTSLYSDDLNGNEYVVYRHLDTNLAEQVAIEASPFVKAGVDVSWSYNLGDALGETCMPTSPGDIDRAELARRAGYVNFGIDEDESVLAVAQREKLNFFCTQWMVWIYNITADKMRKGFSLGISPKQALPGVLVKALDESPYFKYTGKISKSP